MSGDKGVLLAWFPGPWAVWALFSAAFAALTAIFAKVGVEGVDSDLATLARTLVVAVALALLLATTGRLQSHGAAAEDLDLPGSVRPGDGGVLAVLFPRPEAWRGEPGRANRQAQRRAGRLFGAAFLGERLSSVNWLGVALIASGALLVAFRLGKVE